jgi:hypothetical protein
MKKIDNDRIEQEVLKTLEGFRHPESVKVNPFFSARLQAEMARREKQPEHLSLRAFSKELCYPALLLIIIVINVFFAESVYNNNVNANVRNNVVYQFAQEYSLVESEWNIPNQ